MLVLIRHGESINNVEKRFTGNIDTELTLNGGARGWAAMMRASALSISSQWRATSAPESRFYIC